MHTICKRIFYEYDGADFPRPFPPLHCAAAHLGHRRVEFGLPPSGHDYARNRFALEDDQGMAL